MQQFRLPSALNFIAKLRDVVGLYVDGPIIERKSHLGEQCSTHVVENAGLAPEPADRIGLPAPPSRSLGAGGSNDGPGALARIGFPLSLNVNLANSPITIKKDLLHTRGTIFTERDHKIELNVLCEPLIVFRFPMNIRV